MTIVALFASLPLEFYAVIHFFTHHRNGISAAAVGACGWVGTRTHLTDVPLFSANPGKRKTGMPQLEPIGERNPKLVAELRAEAVKARKAALA